MKRVVVMLLLAMCVTTVWADEGSDKVLSKMTAKISSMGDYKVSMVVLESRATGELTVSGERYYMDFLDAMGLRVVCDGKTKYEINSNDREVIVSNVDAYDRGLLSSPTTLFQFAGDLFSHKYVGTQSINGVSCDVISMEYDKDGSEFTNIILAVGSQSGLPVKVTYSTPGKTYVVEIDVLKFESIGRAPKSLFQFNSKDYADYEVIDFR